MLHVVPTTLLKATDPLEWSCNRRPGVSWSFKQVSCLKKCGGYHTQCCKLLKKVSSSNWFIYKLHFYRLDDWEYSLLHAQFWFGCSSPFIKIHDMGYVQYQAFCIHSNACFMQNPNTAMKVGLLIKKQNKMFEIWNLLYCAVQKPHPSTSGVWHQYAVYAWSPYLKTDIGMLERVQRRVTKLVPSIKHLSYPGRLRETKL